MELVIKENEKKADLPVKKLIPEDLHDFLDVFDDSRANQFPESNVWDHKIDMMGRIWTKIFQELQSDTRGTKRIGQIPGWKGYIQLSQLPQASPFFFVKKKDGRLWPCQDYRYLND
jgi:hypothetical protein